MRLRFCIPAAIGGFLGVVLTGPLGPRILHFLWTMLP